MASIKHWVCASFVLLAPVAVACGGDDGTHGGKGGTFEYDPTSDRSEACQRLGFSICDRALRCGNATNDQFNQCIDDAASFFCKSDEAAESCSNEAKDLACLAKSTCGDDAIDLDKPVQICNDYVTAFCKFTNPCTGETDETCKAAVAAKIDCNNALGVLPGWEKCLDDLKSGTCDPASSATPDSCKNLIKISG